MITRRVYKGRYLTYLDPWVARARCKVLSKQLAGVEYGCILTNDHGIAAENVTGKPVVIFTDVMLSPVHDARSVKPSTPFFNTPFFARRLFQHTIKKSLERAALCVFPAKWQEADAALYGVPPNKIALIPFGANIPDPGPEVADNRDFQAVARAGRLDLLFVGKDWQRKGGPMAVRITAALREAGIDAVLHVVGPRLADMPPYMQSYGLLEKNNVDDWSILDRLYRDCHVFLFPSLSEGSAIVPREASAYGLPTIAYCIDGLAGVVEDGVNGVLLDVASGEDAFVRAIKNWRDNPAEYQRLVISSRRYYEANARWSKIVTFLLSKVVNLKLEPKND